MESLFPEPDSDFKKDDKIFENSESMDVRIVNVSDSEDRDGVFGVSNTDSNYETEKIVFDDVNETDVDVMVNDTMEHMVVIAGHSYVIPHHVEWKDLPSLDKLGFVLVGRGAITSHGGMQFTHGTWVPYETGRVIATNVAERGRIIAMKENLDSLRWYQRGKVKREMKQYVPQLIMSGEIIAVYAATREPVFIPEVSESFSKNSEVSENIARVVKAEENSSREETEKFPLFDQ